MKPIATRLSKIILMVVWMLTAVFFANIVYPTIAVAETAKSSLAGVNLRNIHVHVETKYELREKVLDRIKVRFNEARLTARIDEPYTRAEPLLLITLRPLERPSSCEGHVYMIMKIELWEMVELARQTKAQTWAPTWFYGLPDPVSKSNVNDQYLMDQLDHLLTQFIFSFNSANPR